MSDNSFHPPIGRVRELIEKFRGRKMLVVGDVMLDQYMWGDVSRTSQEAPVPVVALNNQNAAPGGAANVASNLAALGARATVIGALGDDEDGRELKRSLTAAGVSGAGLVVDRERPTTVKIRVMSMGHQLIRMDRESAEPLSPQARERLLAQVEKRLPDADGVVVSDYAKGVLLNGLAEEIISRARDADKIVVVDPKGSDYRRYRNATVIKPNRSEAQSATGIAIHSLDDLREAARKLLRITHATAIAISRGGEGASVFQQRRKEAHVSAQARAVYDESGCGDSFVAAMAMALAAGASFPEAVCIGNAAGSVVVAKLGVATLEPLELLRALDPGDSAHKTRSLQQLVQEREAMRARGLRVVFTNGCFDLIHLGHIKFLEQARQQGDALIVAINSDASVRKVKGPPRPLLHEEERAAILASLDAVDRIVVFDDATPTRTIEAIEPDILVKGKGLKKDEIVGQKEVEAAGGRVVSLPFLGDTTTDDMLRRIGGG